MHASSLENMQKCFTRYICPRSLPSGHSIQVIDIGGANINGSYADIFSGPEFTYQAADIHSGPGIDIVLEDPYTLPFPDSSIDIVVSGQAFEHVEFFWQLFTEMVRVLNDDGLLFLVAPSSGPIHQYPVDCYRFYPDAYSALAKYCKCYLIDCWLDSRGPWHDLVGVFSKSNLDKFDLCTATSSVGCGWSSNKYEAETAPCVSYDRHPDEQFEHLVGAQSYLEVLDRMHETLQPDFYLEIGVRKGKSLLLSEASRIIAVDPQPDIEFPLSENRRFFEMTSDDFFEFNALEFVKNKPDFVFIDGMHLFEFALRDFMNVEMYSNQSTVIVIDDIFPNHPAQASRQRKTNAWTGDVWKLYECLKEFRPDLDLMALDTHPTGLLVVSNLNPTSKVLWEDYNPIVRKYKGLELVGAFQNKILDRAGAVSPKSDHFEKWLSVERQRIVNKSSPN